MEADVDIETTGISADGAERIRAALLDGALSGALSRDFELDPEAGELIRRYVDRILTLHESVKRVRDEIAEQYASAKANGLDKNALSALVRRLMEDDAEREEREQVLRSYEQAFHAAGGRTA